MPGNAIRQTGVCAGGEIELATLAALRHQVLEQWAIVGQVLDIEGDARGDFALETGLAAQGPERRFESLQRASADEQQQRVDQRVRLDEGAVKVDAERAFESWWCRGRHAAPDLSA
jgi:hypothetical protein